MPHMIEKPYMVPIDVRYIEYTGNIMGIGSANEKRRYNVTSFLIGGVNTYREWSCYTACAGAKGSSCVIWKHLQ